MGIIIYRSQIQNVDDNEIISHYITVMQKTKKKAIASTNQN